MVMEVDCQLQQRIMKHLIYPRLYPQGVIRIDPKNLRDEINWSLYADLDQHLGYFIIIA